MADWSLTWNVDGARRRLEADFDQRLRKAGILVRDAVKRSINRGNARGKFPSLEGEPPKKVSTRLFQSITASEPMTDAKGRVVYVGTKIIYARRLELGFMGTDSRGHVIHQGPRPYVRPGLHNNRDQIAGILGVSR